MNKKIIAIPLLFLFFLPLLKGQENQEPFISQNAEFMAVDHQGCTYLVHDATLFKYSLDGKFLFSYSDNMMGQISSIDVGNPLKIMIFYKDAGVIRFLNDKLSPIGNDIDLFASGLNTTSLATYSTKNEIILFDENNNDLVILDFYFNVKERIHNNFSNFHPFMLMDVNEKMIVMQDAEQGIFFFDNFGTFEKTIPLLSPLLAQVIGDDILYVADGKLCSYNHRKLEAYDINIDTSNLKQILRFQHQFFLLKDDGVYKIANIN